MADEVQVTITFLNTWIPVPDLGVEVLAKPEDPMGTFYVRRLGNVQVQDDSPPWDQG